MTWTRFSARTGLRIKNCSMQLSQKCFDLPYRPTFGRRSAVQLALIVAAEQDSYPSGQLHCSVLDLSLCCDDPGQRHPSSQHLRITGITQMKAYAHRQNSKIPRVTGTPSGWRPRQGDSKITDGSVVITIRHGAGTSGVRRHALAELISRRSTDYLRLP
jgi:hypothetical protein